MHVRLDNIMMGVEQPTREVTHLAFLLQNTHLNRVLRNNSAVAFSICDVFLWNSMPKSPVSAYLRFRFYVSLFLNIVL